MYSADLRVYLPDFITEIKDIKEILDSENVEFGSLYCSITEALNNSFVITCNEETLIKYEKMLNIKPSLGESVDIRRKNVLEVFSDSVPYTLKAIEQRISKIQGNNNFDITFDEASYTLTIRVNIENGQINALNDMVRNLPCNLVVVSINKMNGLGKLKLYTGISVENTEKYIIK